jgi:hypothetical protein
MICEVCQIKCVMGSLVHTGLGSSSLVAHVLPYPPPPHANSFVLGPAVVNTHNQRVEGITDSVCGSCGLACGGCYFFFPFRRSMLNREV